MMTWVCDILQLSFRLKPEQLDQSRVPGAINSLLSVDLIENLKDADCPGKPLSQ
jgi:hypothetical protein